MIEQAVDTAKEEVAESKAHYETEAVGCQIHHAAVPADKTLDYLHREAEDKTCCKQQQQQEGDAVGKMDRGVILIAYALFKRHEGKVHREAKGRIGNRMQELVRGGIGKGFRDNYKREADNGKNTYCHQHKSQPSQYVRYLSCHRKGKQASLRKVTLSFKQTSLFPAIFRHLGCNHRKNISLVRKMARIDKSRSCRLAHQSLYDAVRMKGGHECWLQ